jgi:hypothetical protein
LTIVSPSPLPPYFRVVEESACVNAPKIESALSRGIPIPVSLTEKRIALRNFLFEADLRFMTSRDLLGQFRAQSFELALSSQAEADLIHGDVVLGASQYESYAH